MPNWIINASVSPSGSGTVTGTGEYADKSTAILTATANNGFKFDNWTLDGYTRLEYIESSGTQYIKTLIQAQSNPNFTIIGNMATNSPSTGLKVLCGMIGGSDTGANWVGVYQGKYALAVGGSLVQSNIPFDSNLHTFSINNNVGYIDGNSIGTGNNNVASYNYYLFARNNSGSADFISDGIIARFTINGVCDFIPVIRHSDYQIGMLDLCEMKFYGNDGAGTFTGGTSQGSIVFLDNPLSFKVGSNADLIAYFDKTANCMIKVNGSWVYGMMYFKVNGQWVEGKPYIKVNGQWKEGI